MSLSLYLSPQSAGCCACAAREHTVEDSHGGWQGLQRCALSLSLVSLVSESLEEDGEKGEERWN